MNFEVSNFTAALAGAVVALMLQHVRSVSGNSCLGPAFHHEQRDNCDADEDVMA